MKNRQWNVVIECQSDDGEMRRRVFQVPAQTAEEARDSAIEMALEVCAVIGHVVSVTRTAMLFPSKRG